MHTVLPKPEPPQLLICMTHNIINSIAEELTYQLTPHNTNLLYDKTTSNSRDDSNCKIHNDHSHANHPPFSAPLVEMQPITHFIPSQYHKNNVTILKLIQSTQTTPVPLSAPLQLLIDRGAISLYH
jgi:hypothetical protein